MPVLATSTSAPVGKIKNAVFKNPATGEYVWDDIIQPLMGKRLDTTAGKLDYDWSNKGVSIADSTVTSNDAHKVHFGYQIYHRFKLDGLCNPHIHWIQAQADVPNWWMRWRVWQNGEVAGAWTEVALDTHAFTYTAGTILQISEAASKIDFSALPSGGLNVSDFLDIEVTRDSNNASTLFAGADPVAGNVTFKGFDPHLQIDATGSVLEFQK